MTAIVFDLGGVLASEAGKIEALATLWGVPADQLVEAYWAHRQPYDEGQSNIDYFSLVAADLGVPMDEELADRLGAADADHWAAIRPEAEQILADLQAAGVPTAILSNAPTEMAAAIDRSTWRQWVGPVIVSGAVGAAKPHREIFTIVEESLGLPGEQLVFIDDRQPNVDGAVAAGWQAHLWTDDSATRQLLVDGGWLS